MPTNRKKRWMLDGKTKTKIMQTHTQDLLHDLAWPHSLASPGSTSIHSHPHTVLTCVISFLLLCQKKKKILFYFKATQLLYLEFSISSLLLWLTTPLSLYDFSVNEMSTGHNFLATIFLAKSRLETLLPCILPYKLCFFFIMLTIK